MPITLRPFRSETDIPRMAEILTQEGPEVTTAEALHEHERRLPPEMKFQRIVAADESDRLVGWATAGWGPWLAKGRFSDRVFVDPALRRQGIGSRLFEATLPFLRENGAERLDSYTTTENDLRFAEKHGFRVDRHLFESTLQLDRFDPSSFAGIVEAVQASGIRFTTMADLEGDPEARRKLWELEEQLNRDIPGYETQGTETPFEEYVKLVFDAVWYRPDLQLLALDGDRFVGMHALGLFDRSDKPFCHINMTGVLREYRGRKIAHALKLLGVEAAGRYGAQYLRTNNDSQNQGMLAINQHFGFVPRAGKYVLVRYLDQ